jgi:hypothetical protein
MPGWYPDPEAPERQRFWDGNRWTELRAHPVVNVGQPAATGIPGPVPDERRRSNPWIVVAIIAIVAAVLFALAWYFLLRDSGEQAEPVVPVAPAPATPSAPLPSPTVPPGA